MWTQASGLKALVTLTIDIATVFAVHNTYGLNDRQSVSRPFLVMESMQLMDKVCPFSPTVVFHGGVCLHHHRGTRQLSVEPRDALYL